MPPHPAISLDEAALRLRLTGTRFRHVEVVAETGSTNDDLVRAAANGAPDGTVLIAEHQTGGRGRIGRRWESPPALGVLMSALLVPGPPVLASGLLPLAAGMAALSAARTVLPGDRAQECKLKWPNDVVAAGAKLGGVLCESGPVAGQTFRWSVVGIGLNVNHRGDDLPPGATSLALLADASDLSRLDVLAALLGSLDAATTATGDADVFIRSYSAECMTLGQEVRVEQPRDQVLEGCAVRIAPGGGLVVDRGEDEVVVHVGDVVHVRAAGPGHDQA